MTFTLTDAKINLNIWLSTGAAGISFFLCGFVVLAAAWVRSKPQSKRLLDRVSFRLFLWSMLWELVYDLAYIAVEVESVTGTPNTVCATGVYFMIAPLGVVNYLCTCIAINLMLTVSFGVNPLERHLERWYVGISTFLGLFIPIIPAALGHFGWDPVLDVCWIQAADDNTRLKYFVLDLYLWQSLSCLVATVAVIVTLFTLVRQSRLTSTAMASSATLRKGSMDTLGTLRDRFFGIALRIAVYPLALIVVNGIITVGDLYISKVGGVHSVQQYGLYVVYYLLYGGRGIVFALLGICVDPCLRRGIKSAWHEGRRPRVEERQIGVSRAREKQSFAEILGEATPLPFEGDLAIATPPESRRPSQAELELSQALARLPIETPLRLTTWAEEGPSHKHSKTFSGVREDCLPEGLTDEVEDIRGVRPAAVAPDEEARVTFEPLEPDLPDAEEEKMRYRKARRVEREEAIRQIAEAETYL